METTTERELRKIREELHVIGKNLGGIYVSLERQRQKETKDDAKDNNQQ